MATQVIAGHEVAVDDEGFMTDPSQWSDEIAEVLGVPTKQLYTLFPKKPAKKMAYVSGLPKPKGCV